MRGLGRGQDGLDLGELHRRVEHIGLLGRDRLHIAVVVQLGQDRAHAVVAQAARVVGRRHKAVAQGVHARQRSDVAGVAEVVGVLAAGKRRAGRGLDRDDARVGLAGQLILHERRDQAAEVGAAARAADDDVRIFVQHLHRLLALQTDDRLVQQHLIEHRAEHITVALVRGRDLDRLGDRAAERAAGVRVVREDRAACLGGVRGRGRHVRAEGLHDRLAVGLLLIGYLYHVDLEVQPEVGARLGQRRAPLAGSGLGRQALEALLLGVVRLRDGRVELVRA